MTNCKVNIYSYIQPTTTIIVGSVLMCFNESDPLFIQVSRVV